MVLLLGLTASLLTQAAGGTSPDSAHRERIARIERRLLPATPLSTDADSGWRVIDRLRHHKVAGMSVALVHDGRVAWTRQYGVRVAGTTAPVTPTTLFQSASISKPVASVAVLQLAQRGTVSLDSNVNQYLRRWRVPENRFTAQQPVTLRLLLSHRAGVTVRGFDGYAASTPVPTLLQILRGTAPANSDPITVDTTPGAINRYSGGGFEIAQLAVEEVTRAPFDQWLRDHVLRPAQMPRSTYSRVTTATNGGDIARGHDENGAMYAGGWYTMPEMAAASLWSTPTELARFMIRLQDAVAGRDSTLLSPAMARAMMQLQSANQGIGIGLKGDPPYRFSHSGSNNGYRAMFIGYLDRREGIVVLTNGENGDALQMEYIRAVAREYGWGDLTPRVRTPLTVSPAVAAGLAGRYRLGENWTIDVQATAAGLVAGPTGRALLPLHAESNDAFFFTAVEGVGIEVAARSGDRVDAITWIQGDRRVRGTRITPP